MRVCFHGAESTGKSTLANKLAADLGYPMVHEFGRTYAESNNLNFTMDDLLFIAAEQDRMMREAASATAGRLILDTDPLMTAAWARMLFGRIPDELLGYDKAELYLLFSPDVPWRADGTRFFGTHEQRARFAAIAEDVLVRAKVPFTRISGDWATRERQARAAIENAARS